MRACFLAALLLAMPACGSDDPMDPMDAMDPTDPVDPDEARDYDDVAATLGSSLCAGELLAMSDAVAISEGRLPDGFAYIGQDGDYHHVSGVRGGITFDYRYHCNDAGHVILPCDGSANHSHLLIGWTGSAAGATASVDSISRMGKWDVRDLSVDKPRVGGSGDMSFVATVEDSAYNLTYDATFDRVRYAPDQAFPVSGSIQFLVTAARTRGDATRTFAVNAFVEFAGTAMAMLTLDASRRYSIDLTSGAVTKL